MDLLHDYTGNDAYEKASKPSFEKKEGKLVPLKKQEQTLIDFTLFNANDVKAFTLLYDELFPYVYFHATKFLGSDDALDIVEIIFIRLWQLQDKKFVNIAHVKGFVKTMVRNQSLNHLTYTKSKIQREKQAGILNETEPAEYLEREAVHAELMDKIYRAIENLPKKARTIFKMAYLEQLKNKEIARRLGIAEKTVKNQKNLALKSLRVVLISFLFVLLLY